MQNPFKKKYKIIDRNPYNNLPLNCKGMIFYKNWDKKYINIINDNDVKAFFFNCSLGWSEENYKFIKDLPSSTIEINILDDYARKLEGIEELNDLVKLKLDAIVESNIDYSKFKCLKEAYIHAEGLLDDSLYNCISLENLHIDEFKKKNSHSLGRLKNLKELIISNSNITNLSFIKSLNELETLELFYCKKIESFEPIFGLKKLKKLHISGYNDINDISFVSNLHNLEVLIIDAGIVNSIEPISELYNLKALAIYGNKSKINDGKLQVLNKLPNLSILDIPNRKDYIYKINNYWNWDDVDQVRDKWVSLK